MVRKTNYDMEVKRQNQEKRFYFYPDEVVNTSFGYHLPGGRSLGILDLHRRYQFKILTMEMKKCKYRKGGVPTCKYTEKHVKSEHGYWMEGMWTVEVHM